MKCKICLKSNAKYKIRVYKEIWIDDLRYDKLTKTIFICEDCINKTLNLNLKGDKN